MAQPEEIGDARDQYILRWVLWLLDIERTHFLLPRAFLCIRLRGYLPISYNPDRTVFRRVQDGARV